MKKDGIETTRRDNRQKNLKNILKGLNTKVTFAKPSHWIYKRGWTIGMRPGSAKSSKTDTTEEE